MNAVQHVSRVAALVVLGVTLCLTGCSKTSTKAAPAKPGISLGGESIPLGMLPRVAIPARYRVALRIDPRAERFSGHVEIDVNFLKARRSLFLHGLDLNVSGVTVRLKSGQSFAAHYDQVDRSGVARLIFVDEVPVGEATLIFDYDAPYDHSLEGLYKVVDRGDAYAFTQFESTDARRAFPSFDEPGFKTPFDITVIAPKGMTVIGNTPTVSASPASKGMTETVFATTKALPTYLVALAVGPLDVVDGGWVPANKYRAKPLHIRGVTARGNGPRIAYALSLTPKIVTALENYFGIGFPFQKLDVLAVPDFAAGAMENAGAITFRERLLLIDPGAPLDQKRGSLSVQAHELAHQWFGDLVTPAWWDDIWLNESFATWMAAKASATVQPEMGFETDTLRDGLDVMDLDELPSARQIHQPIHNVDDLANAFDSITYDKGAAVLRMFEAYAGPEGWQRGIHAYLTKFARGNATAHDFIGTIAGETGHPEMIAAFDDFIDRSGVPYLALKTICAPQAFSVVQSMYTPLAFTPVQRLWHVPVCSAPGVCKMGEGAQFSVPFSGLCAEAPLPNDGGTGYYRFALGESEWQRQIAGAAKLDPVGQITLAANLFAALPAGKAQAADVFALVHALAPVARWDVLQILSKRLAALRRGLADSDLPAYRAFISRNFGPRLKALGIVAKSNEAPSDALAREYLATLMVTEARDAATLAEMAAAAQASFVPGADPAKSFAPELRGEALRAALIADPAFADTLIQTFETTNQEFYRRDIVYAFAGSTDPAALGKLLALAATKIRIGELRYLTQYMAEEPVASDVLWRYVGTHYDDFARRLSLRGMGGMATVLQYACEPGARGQADDFFHTRLGGALGAGRRVAHTEEGIDRCIAFRKAKGSEITTALATAP
ncbi:MAG TPA: M1 family metallopeptidase [Rhizomicrobium sp.]|nr:M1 family metallopeptidase [Rhizomicrobium sp.]